MIIIRLVLVLVFPDVLFFFFFNDTATTEIYTLSLHDALPIYYLRDWLVPMVLLGIGAGLAFPALTILAMADATPSDSGLDRKSTRLNSSHSQISYAVFCLKKKKDTDVKNPVLERSLVLNIQG